MMYVFLNENFEKILSMTVEKDCLFCRTDLAQIARKVLARNHEKEIRVKIQNNKGYITYETYVKIEDGDM